MKKKLIIRALVICLAIVLIASGTIAVGALEWEGETGGISSGSRPANSNYFWVAYSTATRNVVGWRFTYIKADGSIRGGKSKDNQNSLDVWLATCYSTDLYNKWTASNCYNISPKLCKKDYTDAMAEDSTGGTIPSLKFYARSSTTAQKGCVLESNSTWFQSVAGATFNTALPYDATKIAAWCSNDDNMDVIAKALGYTLGVAGMAKGDKIIVEPIIYQMLDRLVTLTPSEYAAWGAYYCNNIYSDGYYTNTSGSTSGTWGFTRAYTNHYYPLLVYTPNVTSADNLWPAAVAPSNSGDAYSNLISFQDILSDGFGVGIAYHVTTVSNYTLTVKPNGGTWNGSTAAQTFTLAAGSTKTISNPTQAGYTFSGWVISGGGSVSGTTYTQGGSNCTLTASWTPNTYYVTYDANGGTGAPAKQAFVFMSVDTISTTTPTREGYTFSHWLSDPNSKSFDPGDDIPRGWGSFTLVAQWIPNTYIDYISHLALGFDNNEGNTYNGIAFHIGDTTFNAEYGSEFVLDSSNAVTVPNGFYLEDTVHLYSASGTWIGTKPLGSTITQEAYSMGFDYIYSPYDYNITYELDGGTNDLNNPATYNVLYGVSLKDPAKAGYTFAGWYIGDTKVTGINEGANATFSSASDLYTQLAARTTGDITLTARWNGSDAPPTLEPITPNASYRENTEVITSYWLRNTNETSASYTTSNPLTVRIRVYNGNTLLQTMTQSDVIVPEKESQLIWFKWTVPSLTGTPNIRIVADIRLPGAAADDWFGEEEMTYGYSFNDTMNTPDTQYEEKAPDDFIKPSTPFASNDSVSWTMWEYKNGQFVETTYGFNVSVGTATITPDSKTAYQKEGVWYMKSGYGFFIETTGATFSSLSGCTMPSSDVYTDAQYSYVLYPEYMYQMTSNDQLTTLEYVDGKWQLPMYLDYNARKHFTQIWFPDGNYEVELIQSDIWTPAGMLTVSGPSATMMIEGDIYDDWYIGHG